MYEKETKSRTQLIVLVSFIGLFMLLICFGVTAIMLRNLPIEEEETSVATFVDETAVDNDQPATDEITTFSAETLPAKEPVLVTEVPETEQESSVDVNEDVVMDMDAILAAETEAAEGDYSEGYSDSSNMSFSEEHVVDNTDDSNVSMSVDSITTTQSTKIDVSYSTLDSQETIEQIYDKVPKDEQFDADLGSRAQEEIFKGLQAAKKHMGSEEGATTALTYAFATDESTRELLLYLTVLDDSNTECFSDVFALGVPSLLGE